MAMPFAEDGRLVQGSLSDAAFNAACVYVENLAGRVQRDEETSDGGANVVSVSKAKPWNNEAMNGPVKVNYYDAVLVSGRAGASATIGFGVIVKMPRGRGKCSQPASIFVRLCDQDLLLPGDF